MSKTRDEPLDRFHELAMKALDDELTAEERLEFEKYLENPELLREWQAFSKLREVTKTMKLKNPPEEVWDNYWLRVYNRLERGLAWVLFSIGAVVLIVYTLYQAVEDILQDAQLPLVVKVGILSLMIGGVILLVSVVREKFFVRKRDPYKEVQR